MNICEKEKGTEAIAGHLYISKVAYTELAKNVCIYTKRGKMVRLIDGSDSVTFSSINNWKDVTDQYCLQKVK